MLYCNDQNSTVHVSTYIHLHVLIPTLVHELQEDLHEVVVKPFPFVASLAELVTAFRKSSLYRETPI